jgi:hypothetical protein
MAMKRGKIESLQNEPTVMARAVASEVAEKLAYLSRWCL